MKSAWIALIVIGLTASLGILAWDAHQRSAEALRESRQAIHLTTVASARTEDVYQLLTNYIGTVAQRIKAREDTSATRDAARGNNCASITPDTTVCQSIDFGYGTFYVSTSRVEPYLDGYKVTLQIGNPYQMTVESVVCRVHWAPSIPTNLTDEIVLAYNQSVKRKEFSILKPLAAGRWNVLEFTIAPATADELRNCGICFEGGSIYLKVSQ
jgi:hypothetical protein